MDVKETWEEADKLPQGGKEHRDALVEEIRSKEFRFGGYDHQGSNTTGAPVFSDGTTYTCSLRGWGGIMSEVWGPHDAMGYCTWAWCTHEEEDKTPWGDPE